MAIDETLANNGTREVVVAIDVSEVVSVGIVSSVAVTLKTNDSGTPDDTIVLSAGVPYIWSTSSLDSLLLTEDVTSIFVVVPEGADAAFKLVCVQDATP